MQVCSLPIKTNPLATRRDLQDAFHQLCEPLIPYFSEGKAHLKLGATGSGCTDETAEMEGFSRILWGLAPLAAGGGDSVLWDIYRQGIRNGTNPEHEEYWGIVNDYDQKLVEMAAFGLALGLAPDQVWNPLTDIEKQRFYDWLNQMNSRPVYDCNWLFFLVMVNLGFKKIGMPYDREQMDKNLGRIDEFYLTDGWYSDGKGGHCDYYGPFAIHYYGLIYAAWMKEEDPERAALYKERASEFAKDFIYWFAGDGSALPYGRSLTYRFSQAAFWSAMAYTGVEAFPYGVIKGIILRHMRWWFQQPIFQPDGTLSIGYSYPNLIMAENYNAPGSPYWALKTFLPLALPDEHPFWQAEELPLPKLSERSVQQPPHLVICRQEEDNHILAFNAGHPSTNEHTHTSAKYEKFVYSNRFGFSVPRAEWGLAQGAFDSMLALSEGDRIYRVKRTTDLSRIENNIIYMEWTPWFDVEVKTWLIPGAPWHVRVHCIYSKRKLDAADGGFAIGIEDRNGRRSLEELQGEHSARASSSWGTSGIRLLYGSGKMELIHPNANTNLLHARTVIPTATASLSPGISWLVTGVYGHSQSGQQLEKWLSPPRVEKHDQKLVVYMEDDAPKYSFTMKKA
ncbi:DUF2264 domain-containing protein [Paenibacillus prosopidis]|uniref:DUF2264 domain-containing protein n=1 Tax=Paenibacillus prosopidis TaxID=630520 RepID=A0A368W2L4_9BACL|nr:DUF2264 domain-containing protein [Paenibacillus prosopidis]RCW47508.1 hypothetical protein DFP97_108123 [Paenibacillus prosopidis]